MRAANKLSSVRNSGAHSPIPLMRVSLLPFGSFVGQSGELVNEPRMIILPDSIQPPRNGHPRVPS